MRNELLISIRVSLFTILITGLLYPVLITELSSFLFQKQSKGSLIYDERKGVIGSALIGQNYKNIGYFFSRPSFAGSGYDGMSSGASNESPTSQKYLDRVKRQVLELQKYNEEKIPYDLVTASGSGLDPHITPGSALWQAPKIALARDVSLRRVVAIITDHVEEPQFGFLGAERVNVLKLNKALDQYFGPPVTTK